MSYSAEFAGKDEDASLKQHAGIELEQVAHIHCHDQLCQVPLVNPQTRAHQFEWAEWTELQRLHDTPSLGLVQCTLTFSGMDGRLPGSGAMKYGTWTK